MGDAPSIDDEPATALEEVSAALERTVGRGSARIELHDEFSLKNVADATQRDLDTKSETAKQPDRSRLGRLRSRLADLLLPHLLSGVMRVGDRWMRKAGAPYAVSIGVMDFGAHRWMYGYPAKPDVVLAVGDRTWKGTAGSAVDSLRAAGAEAYQPLWLFNLIRGVVEAREQGADDRAAGASRRFSVVADLNRVADAVSHHVALPQGMRWLVDLERIAVEVWVGDDGYIQRIRQMDGPEDAPTRVGTLELSEFGIELAEDWPRLFTPLPTSARV